MKTQLAGIYAALLCPFDAKGKVDEASLRSLVRFNIQSGIDGLYVCGSTGEAFLLSQDERNMVYEIAADEADKVASETGAERIALIAQVGAIATAQSQEMAEVAHRCRYDAISSLAAFYYPFSYAEHKARYEDIISVTPDIPMIIYNIPSLSGVSLTLDQISELVNLKGVAGIKQTSNDLYQMEQIRRANPKTLVLNGFDEIFAASLMMGADGGIGSTYNIMGWRYKAIKEAMKEGNVAKARMLQTKCNEVIDLLVKVGVFRGLKMILHLMGIIEHPSCRKPFGPVDPKYQRALEEVASELSAARAHALGGHHGHGGGGCCGRHI